MRKRRRSLLISIPFCEYGFGICSAPDTICPHWQGTFCELDSIELKIHENEIKRDCYKCVYEVGCHGNPVGCKSYKRCS